MMSAWSAYHLLFAACVSSSLASPGDRNPRYIACVEKCVNNPSAVKRLQSEQSFGDRLLLWSDDDECRYFCMWKAVDWFKKSYDMVPQFHGKWPFVRLWGVQEPASVFFSIVNGLSNGVGILHLRKNVPRSAPLYWLWNCLAVVAINAWIWSTVFHSRDRNFTEMMDYFCAFSFVVFLFFSFFARILLGQSRLLLGAIGAALASFFTLHVFNMAYVKFDYGYNMTVNVTIGVLNSLAWVLWCALKRTEQPYVWKALAVILSTNLLLLLEVFDFPPLFWVFDAHSFWHGGTALLPLLWFSFATDDCKYLLLRSKKSKRDSSCEIGPTTSSQANNGSRSTSHHVDGSTRHRKDKSPF